MKKQELIKKQSEDYKNGTTKSRCVKLELSIDRKDIDFIFKHQQVFSKLIFKDKDEINFRDRKTADNIFLKEVESLVNEHNYTKTFVKRQIIRPVLERYKSYLLRNKRLPNYSIAIKQKDLAVYDGCVFLDKHDRKLEFRFHPVKDKDPVSVPYEYAGTMGKYENYLSDKPGGQLNFRANRAFYTARATIPVTWKYQPKDFVGFDCNKSKETFLTWSKPIIFFGDELKVLKKTHSKLERVFSIEKSLKELNGIENKKSKIRRKIKLKHKYHEKEYVLIVKEILDYFESNNFGIIIDMLSCGARTGTFGQDKLCSLLVRECENRGIPYILCPTPYTTRLCNVCGHLHGKIELSVRKFDCQGCGIELNRDDNAAKNIEARGKLIWELGLAKVEEDFLKKYKVSLFKE